MARKKTQDKRKGRTVQIELGSGRLFLWGGGLLFLLVWIFVLGILVGRGFLPGDRAMEELKEQVGKLQEVIRRDRAQQTERREEPLENPKLAFYEKLSTKKDEALEREAERTRRSPEPARPPEPSQAVQKKEAPSRTAQPAATPNAGRPSPQGPPRNRPGSSAPAGAEAEPSGIGQEGLQVQARYTVQVAATTTRSAAQEMIRRLKRKGLPAYYYDAEVKGTTYYRVRCGRFLSRTEAEQYARQLEKREGIQGFVSKLE